MNSESSEILLAANSNSSTNSANSANSANSTEISTSINEIPKKKSTIWKFLQLIVGVLALAYVLSHIDKNELLRVLIKVNYFELLGAILSTLFMTYLMGWRWQLLVKVRYKVSSFTLFGQYLIAQFFNLFTPGAVGGDLVRMLRVSKITGDGSFVFTSVVVERLVSLVGLVLNGMLGLYLGRNYLNHPANFYALIILLAISISLCLILLSKTAMKRFVDLIKFIETKIGRKFISGLVEPITNHLAVFSERPGLILSIILSTFLVRSLWCVSCWLVALALGLEIPFFVLMALISVVDVARMLPISPPNGIGVREYLLVLLLSPLGINNTQATIFAFVAYSLLMVNGLIGGLLYTSQAVIEN
ncbi:MAG: flippase-like domain-containing protein [Acidobacteria bacterium]|nr:flippase-like domain-containing protein [Acidobacteriota bacterium]